MTTIEDLEQRLAELEVRAGIGVTPLAANPPITIGELTDVPAPGSPIASAWTQEVTRRTMHRFATVAARDAAYPAAAAGAGALCITLDTATVWVVNNAATWVPHRPLNGTAYGVTHYSNTLGANTPLSNAQVLLCSVAMPSAPAGSLLDISWMAYITQTVTGSAGAVVYAQVNTVNQNPQAVVDDRLQAMSYTGRLTNIAQPVGAPFNVQLYGQKLAAGGTVNAQGTNTALHVVSYRP
jgi:hypothetical protein